jgi:molybdate transport system ATP-binding protein
VSLDVALRHSFPGSEIDIAFRVPLSGITVLFGPSGAGKSTVIAAAAGLLRPDSCRIALGGAVLADTASGVWTAPEHRRVGLVFQDARLFPHMRVESNLRYGMRRAPPGRIGFDDVVALLGIAPLLGRRPGTLSGGERQRVAIGRALLAQPRLLLMDEPLASLDAARKAEILPYLNRLNAALGLPVLYVTHALDELVRLADSVVLIEAGRVLEAGPLDEIASRGDLAFGHRQDSGSVFPARVAAHDPARALTRLDTGGAPIMVPLRDSPVGQAVRVRIPAREVILARTPPAEISVTNILPGTVRAITRDGASHAAFVEVMVGPYAVLARVTTDAVARLRLAPGEPVHAMCKSMSIDVLEA